jgi:hypothetical protein
MTREEKVAWTAGFFDGEGCILITNNSKGKGKKRSKALRIAVSQKDRRPLEFLQDLYGGTISPNRQGERLLWVWWLSNRQAANVLEEIAPMLIGKRDEAMLALEFQRRRNKHGVIRSSSQHQWDDWARLEISRMKRRTPGLPDPPPVETDMMEPLWEDE